MEPIGVAVIGAGGSNIATGRHLPALRRVPHAKVVALHDIKADGVAHYAAQYEAEAYTDLGAMLTRDDVDLVIVASPDSFHAEHTIAAVRAGKHVLCEKPIALSLEEALAMRQAVRQAGVKFMACQSLRYEPAARQAGRLIQAGEIGQPVYGGYAVKGRFHPYPGDSEYRARKTKGQFLHNGMHYVDLLSWLLQAEPTRAFGVSRQHYPTDDRLETDNYTLALLQFSSGALGRVEHNLMMIDPPGFPRREETRVMGTEGNLAFGNSLGGSLEVFAADGFQVLQPATLTPWEDSFALLTRDLVEAIIEDRAPPISMDYSIRVLEACLGVVESCETGQPVQLGSGGAEG